MKSLNEGSGAGSSDVRTLNGVNYYVNLAVNSLNTGLSSQKFIDEFKINGGCGKTIFTNDAAIYLRGNYFLLNDSVESFKKLGPEILKEDFYQTDFKDYLKSELNMSSNNLYELGNRDDHSSFKSFGFDTKDPSQVNPWVLHLLRRERLGIERALFSTQGLNLRGFRSNKPTSIAIHPIVLNYYPRHGIPKFSFEVDFRSIYDQNKTK